MPVVVARSTGPHGYNVVGYRCSGNGSNGFWRERKRRHGAFLKRPTWFSSEDRYAGTSQWRVDMVLGEQTGAMHTSGLSLSDSASFCYSR